MQVFISSLVVFGIHYKWGLVQPLLMNAAMMPLQLWDCKAVGIHLLSQKHERPWSAPQQNNPLSQWVEKKKAEAAQAEQDARPKQS